MCTIHVQVMANIREAAESVGREVQDLQRLLHVLDRLFVLLSPVKKKCVPRSSTAA